MTNQTMVERVARAIMNGIADTAGEPHVTDAEWFSNDTAQAGALQWSRAAIQAMREPSRDMVDAGREVGPDAPYGLFEVRERWYTMIDAALEEG